MIKFIHQDEAFIPPEGKQQQNGFLFKESVLTCVVGGGRWQRGRETTVDRSHTQTRTPTPTPTVWQGDNALAGPPGGRGAGVWLKGKGQAWMTH